MLTVISKLRQLYLRAKFEFYGCLFEVYMAKAKECTKSENIEEFKIWHDKAMRCVTIRQKAVNEILHIKGYI